MRELKTRQEISTWITQKLQAFPGCADATVTVQYQLREPMSDGCNWTDDLLLNYGTGDSESVLQPPPKSLPISLTLPLGVARGASYSAPVLMFAGSFVRWRVQKEWTSPSSHMNQARALGCKTARCGSRAAAISRTIRVCMTTFVG